MKTFLCCLGGLGAIIAVLSVFGLCLTEPVAAIGILILLATFILCVIFWFGYSFVRDVIL
jgi:hypothetical protein